MSNNLLQRLGDTPTPSRAFPTVHVLICSYNRPDELLMTLGSLFGYMWYEGPLKFWVADDHSPLYTDRYKQAVQAQNVNFITTPENRGWGGNVNHALDYLRGQGADFIYFTEDDYLLTRMLDLTVGVTMMLVNPRLQYLRYRGIAGDKGINLTLHEEDVYPWIEHPVYDFMLPGKVPWLNINAESSSLWCYTNGPHLKRLRFHDFFGRYPTGLKLGQTEEAYCHQVKDGMRATTEAPYLGILPDWLLMHYDHIGKTYQNTEHDK